jgi:uncharacterized protein (TIGR02118 family)
MITVSVLYPQKDGAKFDMDYYLAKHIPMVQKLLGSALKGCVVEQGLGGGAPGAPAVYSTLCHLRFESVEAFQTAFGPHLSAIHADIPNYSSVPPVLQVSEIKMS